MKKPTGPPNIRARGYPRDPSTAGLDFEEMEGRPGGGGGCLAVLLVAGALLAIVLGTLVVIFGGRA